MSFEIVKESALAKIILKMESPLITNPQNFSIIIKIKIRSGTINFGTKASKILKNGEHKNSWICKQRAQQLERAGPS